MKEVSFGFVAVEVGSLDCVGWDVSFLILNSLAGELYREKLKSKFEKEMDNAEFEAGIDMLKKYAAVEKWVLEEFPELIEPDAN